MFEHDHEYYTDRVILTHRAVLQPLRLCISMHCLHLKHLLQSLATPKGLAAPEQHLFFHPLLFFPLSVVIYCMGQRRAYGFLHPSDSSHPFGNVGPRAQRAPHLQVSGFAGQNLRHLLSCLFSVTVTLHSSKEWDQKPLQQTLLSQQPTSWITFKPAKCQQCKREL